MSAQDGIYKVDLTTATPHLYAEVSVRTTGDEEKAAKFYLYMSEDQGNTEAPLPFPDTLLYQEKIYAVLKAHGIERNYVSEALKGQKADRSGLSVLKAPAASGKAKAKKKAFRPPTP